VIAVVLGGFVAQAPLIRNNRRAKPCPFLGPISRRNAVSTAGTPTRHQSRGKASKFASGSSKATNSRRPSEDYLPL
jgi:hypothetical protein